MGTFAYIPLLSFDSSEKWRAWLEENHSLQIGVWIRLFKKNSGMQTLTYEQALDEALCFGWIDSQIKKYDEKSYMQKFSPRRAKSIWSKTNTKHAERLIKEGKMMPAGLMQIEEAKQDGRWATAYHPQSTSLIPDDFLKELATNKKAKQFFDTLNKTNRYAIAWRLQTAKTQQSREKRKRLILTMLAEERKFHP